MSAVRALALFYGFLAMLAFVLGVLSNLLGLFEVSNVLNLIHLAISLTGFLASRRERYARVYDQVVVGGVGAVLLLLGFTAEEYARILTANRFEDLVHLLSAIAGFVIGFTSVGRKRVHLSWARLS